MAIDPRISLAAQPINVGQRIGQTVSNVANLDLIGQRREQAPFQNRLLELQTELTEAQQPGQLQVAQEAASPLAQLNRRDKARLQSIVQGAQELSPLLEANDIAGARSQLIARKARLKKLNIPTETTDESLELLDSNPELLRQRTAQAITLGEQAGFIKGARAQGLTEFQSLLEGLDKEKTEEAKLIRLKLKSGAPLTFKKSEEIVLVGGVPHKFNEKGVLERLEIEGEQVTTETVAKSKAAIAQRVKFESTSGASRAKLIDKSFEGINKINRGIRNIDSAIRLLNEGAGVGPIEKFFPSFKASTVELQNIIKRMGLDVVGSVTFGALSKGELDLALEVGLPEGLDTPDLIAHLERRRDLQVRLKSGLNELMQHLDTGGTIAGFSRRKEREQGGAPPAPTPGATPPAQPAAQQTIIRFDAQGNIIQ